MKITVLLQKTVKKELITINEYAEKKALKEIIKLEELKNNGFLSEEEYHKEKDRLQGQYISISSIREDHKKTCLDFK